MGAVTPPAIGETMTDTGDAARVQRVAASDEVGGPPFLQVEVGGHAVLLARLSDGTVRAFQAGCPHLGQPLRSGFLDGHTLECPIHFYAYDLDSGANTGPGGGTDVCLTLYEVEERDGEVYVRVPTTPR